MEPFEIDRAALLRDKEPLYPRVAIDPATDPPTVVVIDESVEPISAEKLHQFNLSDFGGPPSQESLQHLANGVFRLLTEAGPITAVDRMQAEWERKRELREQFPKDWHERKGNRGKRGCR